MFLFAFIFCFFFILYNIFFMPIGFCMPRGSDEVNLTLIEAYRPLVNQLPSESSCRYLFDYFEELGNIIHTSRLGHLPGPNEAYDFIPQLFPEQLQVLINSLTVEGCVHNWPQSAQQQYTFSCTELLQTNRECLLAFHRIALHMRAIYFLTNCPLYCSLDLINSPLEDRFYYFLRNFMFSPEAESYYAAQILLKTSQLYYQYDILLALWLTFVL